MDSRATRKGAVLMRDQFDDDPLTQDNLQDWKKELNALAENMFGSNFSDTMTDDDWLNQSIGMTPREQLDEEIYAAGGC